MEYNIQAMRHRTLLLLFIFIFAVDLPGFAAQHASSARPEIRKHERASASKQAPEQVVKLLRQKVKYVFILYQENRSFDSYFGTFPGADGIFSHSPVKTPGFYQTIINTDGTRGVIHPFRIGPAQFAADLDDMSHSHPALDAKMDVIDNIPHMDHYAVTEERRFNRRGNPSLKAKQMGELTMAYEDCDTIPLLWRYAKRFVLFDHIFQLMTGPSTLGNLSIIAAQTGQTQWALHPSEAYKDNGSSLPGVPVLNDNDPLWGSPLDPTPEARKMPVNPHDFRKGREPVTALNLTFATLPLTLWGNQLSAVTQKDWDPERDLADVHHDVTFITRRNHPRVTFGWYQEGYGKGPADPDDGPLDAYGLHASYVTHHNGPQYFGYISNNPEMRSELHDLDDFYSALAHGTLPKDGGVFYVKGGFRNILGLKPADLDPRVEKNFMGDDDHEGYSDSQISEAMVAESVNKIARSPYWAESVIIITWDDSEGAYDQLPPPIRAWGPDGSPITDGPRVPLIIISPYARMHAVVHAAGNQASVVKFIDAVFDLPPLALLPDEERGRRLGEKEFGQKELGPQDALTPGVANLAGAFSLARLLGRTRLLPASYAEIPDSLVTRLPEETGYGCKALGIVTTDRRDGIENDIPGDFNPRPLTTPGK